jgi:hypothetical protein
MTTNKKNLLFREGSIDWNELEGIGILRDELEEAGELETLLSGKKTGIISLALVLLGVDIIMDATLQILDSKGSPILEIVGITPDDDTDN